MDASLPASPERSFPQTGVVQYAFPEEHGRGPRVTFSDWMGRLRDTYCRFYPRVVAHGEYPLRGVREKLCASRRIFHTLLDWGLLEIDSRHSCATQKCITPQSIARTVSAVYKLPLEEILVSDVQYSSASGRTPEEHVKYLWNAYTGDRWLESYKTSAQQLLQSFSPLRSWHAVTSGTLGSLLQVSRATVNELINHGFAIPQDGAFVLRSIHNRVHTRALAQFIALIKGKRIQDTYIELDCDSYFHDLTAKLINNRVLPYLRKKRLNPTRLYTLPELNELLGISEHRLRSFIFTMRNLPYVKVPARGTRTRVAVTGIDIALHELKGERKKQYSVREVAELLSISESRVDKLRLPPPRNGGYGTQQWVYPVYDLIADAARKRFIRDAAI